MLVGLRIAFALNLTTQVSYNTTIKKKVYELHDMSLFTTFCKSKIKLKFLFIEKCLKDTRNMKFLIKSVKNSIGEILNLWLLISVSSSKVFLNEWSHDPFPQSKKILIIFFLNSWWINSFLTNLYGLSDEHLFLQLH